MAGTARPLTGGVAWPVAEATPGIGPQFSGARTLTGVLDEVAATGLSTAAAASTGLENLLPRNGRIDLTALGPLNEQVAAALTAVTAARDELALIDPVAAWIVAARRLQQVSPCADIVSASPPAHCSATWVGARSGQLLTRHSAG